MNIGNRSGSMSSDLDDLESQAVDANSPTVENIVSTIGESDSSSYQIEIPLTDELAEFLVTPPKLAGKIMILR